MGRDRQIQQDSAIRNTANYQHPGHNAWLAVDSRARPGRFHHQTFVVHGQSVWALAGRRTGPGGSRRPISAGTKMPYRVGPSAWTSEAMQTELTPASHSGTPTPASSSDPPDDNLPTYARRAMSDDRAGLSWIGQPRLACADSPANEPSRSGQTSDLAIGMKLVRLTSELGNRLVRRPLCWPSQLRREQVKQLPSCML
jgi:hypothetical protein